MKWVISVNNMVCLVLVLLGKRVKNMIKAIKNIKNTETTLLNPMISMLRRKMLLKDMKNKDQEKVNVLIMVNLDTLVKTVKKNLVS